MKTIEKSKNNGKSRNYRKKRGIEKTGPGRRKMSGDPIRTEQRRRDVFKAVARIMSGRRTGTFTLEEIASRMGGSRELIYYYFKTKADILYQMEMYFFDLIEESIKPIIADKNHTQSQFLQKIIRQLVLVNCEHWEIARALWGDMPVRQVPAEKARSIIRRRQKQLDGLVRLVESVLKEKSVVGAMDAGIISLLISGTIASVARWYTPRGKYTATELADYVVNSVINNGFLFQSKDAARNIVDRR